MPFGWFVEPGRSSSMPGLCSPTISIAFRPCRRMMTIFRPAGGHQDGFRPQPAGRRAPVRCTDAERGARHLAAALWEHTIRDDEDFAAHVDYIHFNPVKHGYIRHVADLPHSTFKACVRRGLYPNAWRGPRENALPPETRANDAWGGSRCALDPPHRVTRATRAAFLFRRAPPTPPAAILTTNDDK